MKIVLFPFFLLRDREKEGKRADVLSLFVLDEWFVARGNEHWQDFFKSIIFVNKILLDRSACDLNRILHFSARRSSWATTTSRSVRRARPNFINCRWSAAPWPVSRNCSRPARNSSFVQFFNVRRNSIWITRRSRRIAWRKFTFGWCFFESVGRDGKSIVERTLLILLLGEIDTLNEKYQASAAIESRWSVPLNQLMPKFSFDDQQRLSSGKSISLPKYSEAHWHPQLFIENSLGDLKETIRYSAKVSDDRDRIFVCEHREIKGLFWEKLELHHFPSDIQELSISIASMLYNDKVMLVSDPYHPSGINREAFVDQQEWFLYEHVDTQQRFIKEFLFRDDDDSEETLEENQEEDAATPASTLTKEKHRPVLTVTCHAGQRRYSWTTRFFPYSFVVARRSNYFYWNGYCLILLITIVSFCIFAIPPKCEFDSFFRSIHFPSSFQFTGESSPNLLYTSSHSYHLSLDGESIIGETRRERTATMPFRSLSFSQRFRIWRRWIVTRSCRCSFWSFFRSGTPPSAQWSSLTPRTCASRRNRGSSNWIISSFVSPWVCIWSFTSFSSVGSTPCRWNLVDCWRRRINTIDNWSADESRKCPNQLATRIIVTRRWTWAADRKREHRRSFLWKFLF